MRGADRPGSIAQALARARGGHWSPQEFQARRDLVRKGRAALEQQLERLTEGVLPLAEYRRRRGDLEQKQARLGQQRQQTARSRKAQPRGAA